MGVAATGAAVARAERQRRAYTPEQVRDRLRERVALAEAVRTEPELELGEIPRVPAWRRRLRDAALGVRNTAVAAAGWARGRLG